MSTEHDPADDERASRPPAGAVDRAPRADAIREQMERILSHPLLEASVRRREMFRYLIEEALAGRGDQLKGYTIALAIFGRDDSFDSQSDPIVRIEARRLRSDLDAYYAGPGRDDPLRIAVPKGGYVPQAYWQNRPAAPEPPAADGIAAVFPQDAATSVSEARREPVSGRMPVSRTVLAAFAAVTLAVVLAWLWTGRAERASTVPDVASVQTVPLLVLPFVATDGGSESGLLAQGLTQELISDFMRFSGLRLFATNASFRQDSEADPTVLGTDIGVSYVVRGSVGAEGNSLRVISDLVEVKTGQVLWSKTFDRQLTPGDVLAVQQDIAGEIAAVLGQAYGVVKTDVAGQRALSGSPGMESYLCVLQAQTYRRTFNPAMHGPALSCLQEAVRRDPTYTDAWAMLGFLQLDEVRHNLIPASAASETMAEALKAASKAIELDPEGVSGLQALAAIDYYSGRIEESETLMRRALEFNPNDPETLAQFGWRLCARGKFDEGIPLVEQAIARTVRPPGWYYHSIAVQKYLQGEYAGAVDAAQRSAVNGSAVGWSIVAAAQASLGNLPEAREAVKQMGEADPDMERDPAAVFRTHQVIEPTVEALVTGLVKAGWSRP